MLLLAKGQQTMLSSVWSEYPRLAVYGESILRMFAMSTIKVEFN